MFMIQDTCLEVKLHNQQELQYTDTQSLNDFMGCAV